MSIFERKTWQLQSMAAIVLFCSLLLFWYGTARLNRMNNDLQKVVNLEQELQRLRTDIVVYEEALKKIDLKADASLQREPVDLEAGFSEDQIGMLREILVSTYESDGFFYLESFELEDKPGKTADHPSELHLSFKGEKMVIFWNI